MKISLKYNMISYLNLINQLKGRGKKYNAFYQKLMFG